MRTVMMILSLLMMMACTPESPAPGIDGFWESRTLDLYSAYAFRGDTFEHRTVQAFPYVETTETGEMAALEIEFTHGDSAATIEGVSHVPSDFGFDFTMDQLTRYDVGETGRLAFRTAPDNLATMVAVNDPFPVIQFSDGTNTVDIALEWAIEGTYPTTWTYNGDAGTGSVTFVKAGTATFSGCTANICILGYFRYGGNS